MLNALSRLVFVRMWKWRVEGHFPKNLNKYLVVTAPHTSNWDFLIGVFTRSLEKADIKFVAKSSLFKFPFGIFFRIMGGYPVDRSKRNNFVDAVVDIFNSKEKFAITITPEGTRSKVDRFRTGFYYIAKGAQIPLVLAAIDAEKKCVRISEPIYTTDDMEHDMELILDFYRGVKGVNPENSIFF